MLLTGTLLTALLYGFAEPILHLLGARDEVLRLSTEYARVIALGAVFQLLATGFVPFIRNMGGASFAIGDDSRLCYEHPSGLYAGVGSESGNVRRGAGNHHWAGRDDARFPWVFPGEKMPAFLPGAKGANGALGIRFEGRPLSLWIDLFPNHHDAADESVSAALRR